MASRAARKRKRKKKLEAIRTRAAEAAVVRQRLQDEAASVYDLCLDRKAAIEIVPEEETILFEEDGITACWFVWDDNRYSGGEWKRAWSSLGLGELRELEEEVKLWHGMKPYNPKHPLHVLAEAACEQ